MKSSETGMSAEIVAVGRELLSGRTVDTNSAWIAARLTGLGMSVTRIVSVDDDPGEIAREIDVARRRGAGLIVTTGGLGPTFDDRTLAGVAEALARPLVEDPAALAFVARRYRELAADGSVGDAALTPPRRKMAMLPRGAEPVTNPVGTAPGALISDAGVTLLALPGVPAEMRAMLDAVLPRLRTGPPRAVAEREVASGIGDESVITIASERVMARVPGVHVKSLAKAFAPDCDVTVRISASGRDHVEAEARARDAADQLLAELARLRNSDR